MKLLIEIDGRVTHNPEREESMVPFETQAMCNSIQAPRKVTILKHEDNNHVLAKVDGTVCTAIFNPFVGMYYVDDVYGVVKGNAWTRDEGIH